MIPCYNSTTPVNRDVRIFEKVEKNCNLESDFATIFTNCPYKWKQFSIIVMVNQI